MANTKNTLGDMFNIFAAQLEKLSDDELDSDALEKEIKRSEAMVKTSEPLINIANLQHRAWKTGLEYGLVAKDGNVTRMLGVKE